MTRDELIAKIKKCMALSKSANAHEAASALAVARRLMDEHGVDQSDILISDIDEHMAKGGGAVTPSLWETFLIHAVKRAIPVHPICWSGEGWRFVGIQPAPEIAAYAFTALYRQLKRARSDYISTKLKRLKKAKRKTARAIPPLLAHLPDNCYYSEPCAGGGHLIDLLNPHGPNCMWAIDIAPQPRRDHNDFAIAQRDVFDLEEDDLLGLDCLITNPPWTRKILHPMIGHLVSLGKPVWLLFDAAWMFTGQATPFMTHCTDIASVGRLRWIEGTKVDPPTDHAWYRFWKCHDETPPRFWPKPNKATQLGEGKSLFDYADVNLNDTPSGWIESQKPNWPEEPF